MSVSWAHSLTEVSYNVANNTSQVRYWMTVTTDGESHNYNGITTTYYIDGVEYTAYSELPYNTTTTIFDRTVTVKHNADGSKSVSASSSCPTAISAGTITDSRSINLTKIPRAATLTAAPNFTDEDNPTITYSNPAGNNVTSLQACISLDSYTVDVPYRDISKTGSSYTFNLTTSERNALINGISSGTSRQVYFVIKTVLNGVTSYSSLPRTFSLEGSIKPTVSATVYDNNSTTTALTGDNQKFIKYFSNAYYSVSGTAKKGATIRIVSIRCGEKYESRQASSFSGTLTAVESAFFSCSASDTRDMIGYNNVEKTLIEYIKPTINLIVNNVSPQGSMTLNATGNYFNQSFGAQSNTLTVQYRYKQVNGTYSSWASITTVKNGNTYTATGTITGLNYKNQYIVQARIVDKLMTVQSDEQIIQSIPVCDWGKNDFNFNVPTYSAAGGTVAFQYASDMKSFALNAQVGFTPFYVDNNTSNVPAQNYGWNSGFVLKRDSSNINITLYGQGISRKAELMYYSGSWKDWIIIGRVQNDSSYEWEYRRQPDGFTEMWRRAYLTFSSWTSMAGWYRSVTTIDLPFSLGYLDRKAMAGSAAASGIIAFVNSGNTSISNTKMEIVAYCPNNPGTVSLYMGIYVAGRVSGYN